MNEESPADSVPDRSVPVSPGSRDLSDDEGELTSGEAASATAFIDEQRAIRQLRYAVAGAVGIVLLSLIGTLFCTVNLFDRQIDKVAPAVSQMVSAGKLAGAAPVTAVAPSVSASATPTVAATKEPPPVVASVRVDIASMANSIVAVISVLVIAIAALTMSLLRSTFSLSPHKPEQGGKAESGAKEKDTGIPVPFAEFLKMLAEHLKDFASKAKGKE